MIIIRPTASLAKKLKVTFERPPQAQPSSCLGDWYAIDLVLERRQFILAVSSASRIAVVVPAAPYASFPDRLPGAVGRVLFSYGVSREKIDQELEAMDNFCMAKTENRSVIGTMNDYRKHLKCIAQASALNLEDLHSLSLKISAIPSLVMPGVWPQEVTLSLFNQAPLKNLVRSAPKLTLVI